MKRHKAVLKGRILERNVVLKCHDLFYYKLNVEEKLQYKLDNLDVIEEVTLKEVETVWEGELNTPILKVGESILVTEIDEKVIVVEVLRATDNSYIYYTDYIIDTIDSETLEENKKKLQKELEKERECLSKELEKIKSSNSNKP